MKKGDTVMLAIFAVLLTAALFTYVYARRAPAPAELIATVSVNGQVVDILSLNEVEKPFRRVYKSAGGFNTVYVDKQGAAVVEADCPDQHCVKTGSISKPGASAVCLPHRFILQITGTDDRHCMEHEDELDGGTY